MKNERQIFSILFAFVLFCSNLSLAQNNLTQPGISMEALQKIASKQLLISWNAGVKKKEKNKIISDFKGKLLYRFRTMNIDLVAFQTKVLCKKAEKASVNVGSIRHAEVDAHIHWKEPKNKGASKNANSKNKYPDPLNPAAHRRDWPHHNKIHDTRLFAKQKEEVLVAMLVDYIDVETQMSSGLIFKNAKEINGIPGVDDDKNGWIDDFSGVTTISPWGGKLENTKASAGMIAGAGNYSIRHLSNKNGKVKILPIATMRYGEVADTYISFYSFTSSILQGIDYANSMEAKIITMLAILGNSGLIYEAVAKNQALFVTSPLYDYFGEYPKILHEQLPNVITVGLERKSKNIRNFYEKELDIIALGELYLTGNNQLLLSTSVSRGMVAGIAGLMLSKDPSLSASQLKDILFSSVNQSPEYYDKIRSNGYLNATKAVLGRSQGGMLLTNNWDVITTSGPKSRSNFGFCQDTDRDLLYLYGGSRNDDFWCWDGQKWKEISQDKRWGKYPGPVSGSFMTYDTKRKLVVLIDPYWKVWTWNGKKWKRKQSKAPEAILDFLSGRIIYDSKRDLLLYYKYASGWEVQYKNTLKVWEYNWNKWTPDPRKYQGPFANSDIVYNSKLQSLVTLGQSKIDWNFKGWLYYKPLVSNMLLVFDGVNWVETQTNIHPGKQGFFLYNKEQDHYLTFGGTQRTRNNYSTYASKQVWKLKDQEWELISNDAPIVGNTTYGVTKKMIWHEKQQKALFLFSSPTYKRYRDFSETQIYHPSIRQYSGSITTTYIDNLIIPRIDLNADGKTDIAVWHPSAAEFRLLNGDTQRVGEPGDFPVPGDYDGDTKVEMAVCHPVAYYFDKEQDQYAQSHWQWKIGSESIDFGELPSIPIPLDYDGDGKTEIAVYDKGLAMWSFYGQENPVYFGNGGDLPVPADYDGDGQINLATYSPVTATWQIQGMGEFPLGEPGDSPVPADFNGDGRTDIGTWNPRKRLWQVMDLETGELIISRNLGNKWDIPVPGDYNGDGRAQIATFSPFTGTWNIEGQPSVKFGTVGDVPLVRGR